MADVPFGEDEDIPAQPIPQRLNVIQYAVAANPEEDWDTCCMCGISENAAPYNGVFARGLVLLADGTLARSAWCGAMSCCDNKYGAIWLPLNKKEIESW